MAGRLTAVVTATAAEQQSAATAACDALWNYRGVRRGEQRESRWIRTAVAAERDGRRWVDLAVGDRSENTFLRWYDRLPATAAVYCSRRYAVYRRFPQDRRCRAKEDPASRAALLLIRDRHCVGKGGAVNWNAGLHSAFAKQAESAEEGVHQERCNAGLFSGAGLRAAGGKIQYLRTLTIPAVFPVDRTAGLV